MKSTRKAGNPRLSLGSRPRPATIQRPDRTLLFSYAFDQLRADVYETGAWSENTNSIKSIEAHGFVFDREEKKWNEKHGQELTMRYYMMTKGQWKTTENN